MKKKVYGILTAVCLALLLGACGAPETPAAAAPAGTEEPPETPAERGEERMLQLCIGDTPVAVEWEKNESAAALAALCETAPLTIQLSMYGGFEQVGPIGERLPRSDAQTTTKAGDIVLYAGDQIVVFYGF